MYWSGMLGTSVQAFRYGQLGFGQVWAQRVGHELDPDAGRQLKKIIKIEGIFGLFIIHTLI